SGVGGLTVFREVKKARPDARYIYLADDARFPYGNQPEDTLIARIADVIGTAIARHAPDLIVVACNTASVIALAVLGTLATVGREYTRALIREFAAGCNIALVGSPRLAAYAEQELAGTPATDVEIAGEILPCFLDEDGDRTDTVVLACTHYPL